VILSVRYGLSLRLSAAVVVKVIEDVFVDVTVELVQVSCGIIEVASEEVCVTVVDEVVDEVTVEDHSCFLYRP